MKLILIRHGEADYGDVDERKYSGFGRDLAKLTPLGIMQAEAVSRDERLAGAQLIVSSPYTRALQTAAILSKNTGLPIAVETDLHEWLPDTTFRYDSEDYDNNASKECAHYHGVWQESCEYRWEDLSHVAKRAYRCMKKCLAYDKVIAVTHGNVMRQFRFMKVIPNCGIMALDWLGTEEWPGFVLDD